MKHYFIEINKLTSPNNNNNNNNNNKHNAIYIINNYLHISKYIEYSTQQKEEKERDM